MSQETSIKISDEDRIALGECLHIIHENSKDIDLNTFIQDHSFYKLIDKMVIVSNACRKIVVIAGRLQLDWINQTKKE